MSNIPWCPKVGDKVVFKNGMETTYIVVTKVDHLKCDDDIVNALTGGVILINGEYGINCLRPASKYEVDNMFGPYSLVDTESAILR